VEYATKQPFAWRKESILPASALHHHGLRVADVRRAGDFYCVALGGKWLTLPFTLEGRGAEQAVGMPAARLRVALIGFRGGAVELFEFLEPAVPDWARAPVAGTVPHVALEVGDVDATLARAEAAGGRRLWPAVDRFGPARVIYLADPDGNVVELLDRPPADIAGAVTRWFPEAVPSEQPR
jgi:catechol 2,3-dioxygenase-like lactoylglutathione lyase family enzyme